MEPHHSPLVTHAGLQHAVLLRAMPVLRHDLSSPLSVMRMGTTLLKRHLQRADLNPADAVARVEQLEQQLTELSAHIRRLRQWDPQVRERHSLKAIALEAAALARPMLMVQGMEVAPLQEDAPGWQDDSQAPHTLLYAVLAAIYHLAEPGEGEAAPASIVVEPLSSHGIQISAQGARSVPDALQIAAPSLDGLALTADAVAQLARSAQFAASVSGRSTVTLTPLQGR
ncbi:hypothetical protein [Paracidovorax sp. MALMAid1276]|uniref:hypothetical protein n=1 Tax=Paracidovorax sp. MALMAid1276 TaxID=3411631 RepID=UPI003B99C28D